MRGTLLSLFAVAVATLAVAFAGGVEIAGVSVHRVTDIFTGGNEAPATRDAGGIAGYGTN